MAKKKTQHTLLLTIAHNIFLTREERYRLAGGESIKITAASVPVWFFRGMTSEPATEVFCEYQMFNQPDVTPDVDFTERGYKIHLPQLPENYEPPEHIPDEQWFQMTWEEREQWYHDHQTPLNGKYLLDPKDGGGAYMRFQIQKKIRKDGKIVDLVHYVLIMPVEDLTTSLLGNLQTI